MRKVKTRGSVLMESRNLRADCSKECFEENWNFLKKVEQMDQQHRGIFMKYINVMKLHQSGSLKETDVKNRVASIFKNCDVLLDEFHRLLKNDNNNNSNSPTVSNTESRIRELIKKLSGEVKEGFIESYLRYKVDNNKFIFKFEVDYLILRDYPLLREEFKRILVDNGLLREITAEEEDDLYEADMFFDGLRSAIEFCEKEGDEDGEKPVSAGVYGAMKRFYKERRKVFKPESMMKNPKLVVQSMLPALRRKYSELEKDKGYRHVGCT